MTRGRIALGAAGERRAAAWYEQNGYRVLDRNWRCRDGELDLVCQNDRTLAFVEVKTRSSLAFGHPAEAVDHRKQSRIRKLAGLWLGAHPDRQRFQEMRFDVVAVLPGEVSVIENAF